MPQTRQELLHRVTRLIDQGQAASFTVPVDTGYFSVEPEVVRRVADLLAETAELMGDIVCYYEEQVDRGNAEEITAVDDTDFLREIGASISSELAAREVADLAFMARNEILDLRRDLDQAVAERHLWKIAAHADAGLGRAARALIPIESAMREYEGMPPMRRRWSNLEDSLEIRRQYGMLWRAVDRAGKPAGEQLRLELRKVGNRIAILRRHKIYPFLRIDDRLSIRKLQKRILAFLAANDADAESGRQLWDDLVAFFRLLMQVNHRHELREHDRRLVLAVYYELSRKSAKSDKIPRETLERLDPLLGRDDDLDRVLLRPDAFSPRDCLRPLERLKEELIQGADTPAVANL